MEILIAVIIVVAIALIVLAAQNKSVYAMKQKLKETQENTIKMQEKLSSTQEELQKSKALVEKNRADLIQARDLNKKRVKRESQQMNSSGDITMENKQNENQDQAINALLSQIEQLKLENKNNEEAIRKEIASEFEKKNEAIKNEETDLKNKICHLEEEIKRVKKLLRPEGNKVDLSALPDEAAAEFARIYKKAKHHEELHGIAKAKLHLAQEKFTELQKRYFATCRELALLSGNEGGSKSASSDDNQLELSVGNTEEEKQS